MLSQRKLNIPVTLTLLKCNLVNVAQQDQQMAKMVFNDPRPLLQNFAAGLIRACLSSAPPIASQGSFPYTLEVLASLVESRKANEECVHSFIKANLILTSLVIELSDFWMTYVVYADPLPNQRT